MNKQKALLLLLLTIFMAVSSYSMTPMSAILPAEGGTFKIYDLKYSTYYWKIRAHQTESPLSSTISWIVLNPADNTGGYSSDNSSSEVTVFENLSTDPRQAFILFWKGHTGSGSGIRWECQFGTYCEVVQEGQNASVTSGQSVFAWRGGESTLQVEVKAGVVWNAVSNVPWIKLYSNSGTGSGSVAFKVERSELLTTRDGTVTIAGKTLTITQQGQLEYGISQEDVQTAVSIDYGLCDSDSVAVGIDGVEVLSSTNSGTYVWQPQSLGNHTISHVSGTNVWEHTLNVTAFEFFVQPAPNSPMAKDDNISITPTTRNFAVGGGGNAIIVSGSSATWTAAVSDPWITLNTTSGNVGYPVAYTVSANTNVEQRTGYVYVSGWVHTVTQDGVGGTISPVSREFEYQGGSSTIAVSAANKMVWQARPNVDWLSVSPTSGAGEGSVTYQVAPYNEVATRQGTLTVAGNTFTVFQYGRRMKLEPVTATQNYETHVIPITVNALAITQWSVTPNNSWISVVDAGNGHGGDLVSIAIAENPSYRERTGTVTIGTETFKVTQQGRPTEELSFSVSPTASTASVNGANGMVSVTATPDLPWTAASGANWITVYAATVTGAGNGNVVYNASPNPTLFERTGTVTVTPEVASGIRRRNRRCRRTGTSSRLRASRVRWECPSRASCSGRSRTRTGGLR